MDLNEKSILSNSANEYIKLFFDTIPSFGKYAECTVLKHGDLLTDCFINIILPDLDPGVEWIKDIGKVIIKSVCFKFNNGIVEDIVEKYDFDYMYVYNSLTLSDNKKNKYLSMMTPLPKSNSLKIPLKFFYNKYIENNMRLISCESTKCVIGIEFEKLENLVTNHNSINMEKYNIVESTIVCNYIYLTSKNRKSLFDNVVSQIVEVTSMQEFDIVNDEILYNVYTSNAYNYLHKNNIGIFGIKDIHNLIFSYLGHNSLPKVQELAFNLDFNGLCKELLWLVTSNDEPLKYSDMVLKEKITLSVENTDAVRVEQDADFFTQYQQYINHTNHIDNVHAYSFSLYPESNKYNGSINFGRINKKTLHLTISCPSDKIYKLKVYAIQYKDLVIGCGNCCFKEHPNKIYKNLSITK